jgi:ubiquinone/menaquinone biosynthesis C-methylase UbiE
MDLDTYRQDSLETWGKMAPGWEDRREWLMGITGPVNAWLLEKAEPQTGQVFLDIAAGTGDLGLEIAERVGDQGRVISTDFAPEMVDVARRQGAARGVSNVDFRVLDAERMDLDDDSFDGVVCRYGYMLMADPAAAMAETRRVLRDGGPLAFAVWGTPDRNPWAAVPAMTLMQRGHLQPPEPGAPGIFALGEPERIRDLVGEAGFAQPVQLEELAVEFRWADFDDLWDSLLRITGPLSRVITALPEDEREAARRAMEENVASFGNADGTYSAPGWAWGVLTR